MPTNRTVSVTSVFAQNASTNIPASPVAGSSYRNANMTTTEVEAGWPFKTIVDSSNFNQTMFELSSIAKQFEQYGFLPWSNLTNYPIGGFALGSNGTLYQAIQATGPATTAMDPTTDTNMTYWQAVQFGSHTGMVSPYAGSVAPTGWLICDGSAISRTTYSALFAVIGTTYGAGDGSTTFNIPDYSSIRQAGVPDFSSGISKSKNTIYQAECDGYIWVYGIQTNVNEASLVLKIGFQSDLSDFQDIGKFYSSPSSHLQSSFFVPIQKGMYYEGTDSPGGFEMIFYPMKGKTPPQTYAIKY